MKTSGVLLVLNILYIAKEIQSSCVLESEFGFSINCNFKQTGLIRVRNLGGAKAYIGLGFSLGDELGFPESLSNLEGNRRRSPKVDSNAGLNLSDPAISKILQSRPKAVISPQQMQQFEQTQNARTIPTFKPLPQNTAQLSEKTLYDQPQIDLKGHTIEELAAFANVSVDVIKAAIKMRQDQMSVKEETNLKLSKTTRRVTTPSASKVIKVMSHHSVESTQQHKVMNAPQEYYPAGYDKNFDDNFKSKIELPATSFHCGDQKHFPGLYADDDLGCMVFHVCALTDDGLVMKSFLCPESTLFDQTILKCNWWFYTDCKSSRSLYDSNLPVSKSYQLMKSLDFFNSHYKNSLNLTRNNISDL